MSQGHIGLLGVEGLILGITGEEQVAYGQPHLIDPIAHERSTRGTHSNCTIFSGPLEPLGGIVRQGPLKGRAFGNHIKDISEVDASLHGAGIKNQAILGFDANTGTGVGRLSRQQDEHQTAKQ